MQQREGKKRSEKKTQVKKIGKGKKKRVHHGRRSRKGGGMWKSVKKSHTEKMIDSDLL